MHKGDFEHTASTGEATGEFRGPSFLLILRDDRSGSTRELHVRDGGEVGRSPECAVCLDDGLVSRRHAAIRTRGDRWWIEDLGSRNGTWVNDHRLTTPVELARGDRLRFGNVTLEVHGGDLLDTPRRGEGDRPAESHVAFQMSGHQSGDIDMVGRDKYDQSVRYYSDNRRETHYYGYNPMLIIADASGLAKALMIIGIFVSFAGFGSWGYPIVRAVTEGFSAPPGSFDPPEFHATPWLPLGAGLMFAGMILFLVGAVLSRRGRR
jgi:hypothetical protein